MHIYYIFKEQLSWLSVLKCNFFMTAHSIVVIVIIFLPIEFHMPLK